LNTDSATEKINQEGVNVCGFESSNKSVGKSLLDVSNESSAVSLIDNCRQVMTANEIKIFEETNIRKDGLMQQFLSIKAPWYDSQDRIIGICGFSIVLGRHSLAESLSTITRMGLLNPVNAFPQRKPSADLISFNLSKREEECLRLTLKGCTAKKIARMLDLSHRTVEEYLTNIKIKMGVKSKSELIELAVNFYSHVLDG
jgi:DNA-binding CsgD family transcriptional regulator